MSENMINDKSNINQDSPEWHSKLLGETEDRFNAGKEKIEDWTQAKKMLWQKFKGVKGQSPFKSSPAGPLR